MKLYVLAHKTRAWQSGHALEDKWIYTDLDEIRAIIADADVETWEPVIFELVPVQEEQ